ncbi:ribosome silencing factor, partial [Merismopedia glauca]
MSDRATRITVDKQKNSTSQDLALAIAQGADDRKGGDIIVMKLTEVSYLTDYFVTVTGFSRVQVRAICQAIQQKTELECDRSPLRIEGQMEGMWVLMDYGDVIVHIMLPEEREFYNLEAFWGHAQRIHVP